MIDHNREQLLAMQLALGLFGVGLHQKWNTEATTDNLDVTTFESWGYSLIKWEQRESPFKACYST